jgi:hypothetical protein
MTKTKVGPRANGADTWLRIIVAIETMHCGPNG